MIEVYYVSGIALFLLGAATGYALANAGMKRKLEELQSEYNTLVDRDPKTGRFVKSMRKLERD
jgi:hypothetical protein